jgi:hypothetical protein
LNVGNLLGSAVLGTFQTWREKAHSNSIGLHLVMTGPQVADRLRRAADSYSPVTLDPVLRGAEGSSLVGSQISLESNVLAYNDTFQLIAVVSLLTALYLGVVVIRRARRERASQPAAL